MMMCDFDYFLVCMINFGVLFLGLCINVLFGDKVIGINYILLMKKVVCYIGGLWVGKFLKICIY